MFLAMGMSGRDDGLMEPLGVVHELHVRRHVGPARGHAISGVLPQLGRLPKPRVESLGRVRGQSVDKRICVAGSQRAV